MRWSTTQKTNHLYIFTLSTKKMHDEQLTNAYYYDWPSKRNLQSVENEDNIKTLTANFPQRLNELITKDTQYHDDSDVKDHCRKINSMAQIYQPFWIKMSKLKELMNQITEIDIYSKKEEANKGSEADFGILADVINIKDQRDLGLRRWGLRSQDIDSDQQVDEKKIQILNVESKMSPSEPLTDPAKKRIFGVDARKQFLELKIKKKKEEVVRKKEEVVRDLQKIKSDHSAQNPDLFPTGPVGDSPIHCCFLLGLCDLGKELISKFYSSPELLSLPYKNDLEPWRQLARLGQAPTNLKGIIRKSWQPLTASRRNSTNPDLEPLEDGLYTGETILHIAIVQEDEEMVQFLLDEGIEISSQAKGVFFQPRFQQPRSSDLTMLQRLKARIIGVDLKADKFAAVKKVENKYSGCYYGEYPLSFAASIGNVDICDQLYCCWLARIKAASDGTCKMTQRERNEIRNSLNTQSKEQEQSQEQTPQRAMFKSRSFASLNSHKLFKDSAVWHSSSNLNRESKGLVWHFVNAADSFGNTAMHMAVINNRPAVIDWLMTLDEGRPSLEMLNHEGFTPLTLAARHGHVEVFDHILYKHMSEMSWTYGQVRISGHVLWLQCRPSRHLSDCDFCVGCRCGCGAPTCCRWTRIRSGRTTPRPARRAGGCRTSPTSGRRRTCTGTGCGGAPSR